MYGAEWSVQDTQDTQGGTASPKLWLIGMNDLLNKLEQLGIELVAFADDLVMMVSARTEKSIRELIKKIEKVINNWCRSTGLKLNADKTTAMWIGKKRVNEEIKLNGHNIKLQKEIKYLGVMLKRTMNWNSHVKLIEQKHNKQVRLLSYVNHLTGGLTIEQKKTLYKQIYLPTILFMSEIWFDELTITQRSKLRSLQNSYVRTMTGAYSRTNSLKLLNLLGLLEIQEQVSYQRAAYQKAPQEKQQIRLAYQNLQGSQPNSHYQTPFDRKEIGIVRSWEVFWMVSKHGPFRTHFLSTEVNRSCRLCSEEEETPEHLLYRCRAVNHLELSDVLNFERVAREIVLKLNRA